MPNEQDHDLVKQIRNIKLMKPEMPGSLNCIDFALGTTGIGTRHLITFRDGGWCISTTIGKIDPEVYVPMPLSQWTESLRKAATANIQEILDCFNIDDTTRRANKYNDLIMFRFNEKPDPSEVH